MTATVIIVAFAAFFLGGLVGWLFGSREAAGATQTVDNLRLQLDEVVKERDANRDAATRLAALEALKKSLLHQALYRNRTVF